MQYLSKSLLTGFFTLLLFATLVFFGVQWILPGDFASQFAFSLGSESMQELQETLGLNLPQWQQYLTWFSHIVRGDFSYMYSLSGRLQPVFSSGHECASGNYFCL